MATKIEFRNGNVRNNIKVSMQDQVTELDKAGKPTGKKYWKTRDAVQVVKPNEFAGAYVGSEGTPARMIIEEMPT
jgi:hypothetical protein